MKPGWRPPTARTLGGPGTPNLLDYVMYEDILEIVCAVDI